MRWLVLPLLIAGCAQMPDQRTVATPERAYLYTNVLNAVMNDNSLCVGHRPGRASDWSGQLSGCPHVLAYQVQGQNAQGAPRQVLRQTSDAQNARVTIWSESGNAYLFGP